MRQPFLDAEGVEAIKEWSRRSRQTDMDHRAQVVFWAPLLCTCRSVFAWRENTSPPQMSCMVHGAVQMLEDGTWM